jgi:hypothetical protein
MVMEKAEADRKAGSSCSELEAIRMDLAHAFKALQAVGTQEPAAIWDGAAALVCASAFPGAVVHHRTCVLVDSSTTPHLDC